MPYIKRGSMTDNKINWEEFKENITNLFAYKPVVGDTGITVEITKEYAEKIGAAYNKFVNPEVNIIITDKQIKILKGISICDGVLSAYKEIESIDRAGLDNSFIYENNGSCYINE